MRGNKDISVIANDSIIYDSDSQATVNLVSKISQPTIFVALNAFVDGYFDRNILHLYPGESVRITFTCMYKGCLELFKSPYKFHLHGLTIQSLNDAPRPLGGMFNKAISRLRTR